MSPLNAMTVGARRALASPAILVWLWLLNLVAAAPAAWIVVDSLEEGIGHSRAYRNLREGFDMEWYAGYREEARGLASTFTPTHAGAGAFYANLERLVRGRLVSRPLVLPLAGGAYALIWLLMLGGVVDRLADRETRPGIRRFFRSGGRFFLRFFRLAAISGVLYLAVYGMSAHLFSRLKEATADAGAESTVIYYSLLIWCLVGLLLTLIHAGFGFAKVATVVEDRRSMLMAAAHGFTFVVRHPARTLGLYYGFLLLAGMALALFALVAPGVGQDNLDAMKWAFVGSQCFLLLKLFLRLSLLGGQAALYREHGVAANTAAIDSPAPPESDGPSETPALDPAPPA